MVPLFDLRTRAPLWELKAPPDIVNSGGFDESLMCNRLLGPVVPMPTSPLLCIYRPSVVAFHGPVEAGNIHCLLPRYPAAALAPLPEVVDAVNAAFVSIRTVTPAVAPNPAFVRNLTCIGLEVEPLLALYTSTAIFCVSE